MPNAQIRETVAWLPKLPRTELAATVCEHLRWHTVTGTPKVQACGQLLERLLQAGIVQLPALRAPPARRTVFVSLFGRTTITEDDRPIILPSCFGIYEGLFQGQA